MININYSEMTYDKIEALDQELRTLIGKNQPKIKEFLNYPNSSELALEMEKISLKIALINYQKQVLIEKHQLIIATIENILKIKIDNYYCLDDGTKVLKDDITLKKEKNKYAKMLGKFYLNDFITYDSFKLMIMELQKEFNYLQEENSLKRKKDWE